MKVIDISRYNGAITWSKAAKQIDGVIIRAGYRGYGSGKLVIDSSFKKNIAGASAAGLPIGVYFVTQAVTTEEAKAEARYTMELVKGYKLSLPIFIDSEDGNKGAGRADRGKLSKFNRTAILKSFCEEIQKGGYTAGIYASNSWFKDYLDITMLKSFFLWVARYSTNKPTIPYNAWQYTDAGVIDGIKGYVDISNFLTDTNTQPKQKSNEEIADEVLAGKWGNGEARKKALTAASYNYRAVQDIVNRKIKERG